MIKYQDDKHFYCYSVQLKYFLQAFNEEIISTGINHNSLHRYFVFNKSARLDSLIKLYNECKELMQ